MLSRFILLAFLILMTSCISTPSSIRETEYEGAAIGQLAHFIGDESYYYERFKHYGATEDLKSIDRIDERILTLNKGYKFEIKTSKTHFEVWGTPVEYGWRTRRSFYANSKDGHIRGADHQGQPSSENDPIIIANPSERKMPIFNDKDSPLGLLSDPDKTKIVAK